jgi:hypothetical protein
MAKRQVNKSPLIELGGKAYPLRLDFTAMADFEDAAGRGVLDLVKPIWEAVRPQTDAEFDLDAQGGLSAIDRLIGGNVITATDARTLLWACVGGEDSGLTLREVGRLVTAANVQEVLGKLWAAVQAALIGGKQDEEPAQESEGNASRPPG